MTRRSITAFAATVLAGFFATGPGRADDRDLLNRGEADPYVFVILDTSGSMNWQPGGDLFAPLNGDDPLSKMYQAKSALFRVLNDAALDGIHWGFGSYNQDDLGVYRKHWGYAIREQPPWVTNGEDLHYLLLGRVKLFGDPCLDDSDGDGGTCDDSFPGETNSTLGGCLGDSFPASYDIDASDTERQLYSFPVLGVTGVTNTTEWAFHGVRYRFQYARVAGTLGDDSIQVQITVHRRTPGTGCPGTLTQVAGSPFTVWFDRAVTTDSQGRALSGSSDLLSWQNPSGPEDPWPGFDDHFAAGTCEGLETNSASDDDDSLGTPAYKLKMATVNDPIDTVADPDKPSRGTPFRRGDFVPLDWKDEDVWTQASVTASHRYSNRNFILRRLAPNYVPGAVEPAVGSVPDFRAAPYFDDQPQDSTPNAQNNDELLRLQTAYAATPPLIPNGSTPIGNSLDDFMVWFDTWKGPAAAGDALFSCRSTNVVVLTDGDETCYSGTTTGTKDGGGDWNPCHVAGLLSNPVLGRNVKTYVVGFGLPGAGNFLDCIATKGGTFARDVDGDGTIESSWDANNDGDTTDPGEGGQEGGPYLPGDEDELVNDLTSIFSSIREGAASFASAAVPSVQADSADKVFLTEFRPVDDTSVWPGRFYAFVKPVPLDAARRPDLSKRCDPPTTTAACFAWEAQEVVVEEQVKPSASDPVGNGEHQRRVYYAEHESGTSFPYRRHFLEGPLPAADSEVRQDLLRGLDVAQAQADLILANMLALKSVTPPGSTEIEYVLGDNFHSDPLSIGEPGNIRYFVANVGAELRSDAAPQICTDQDFDLDRSYRDFAIRHRNRRRMLALGTNDGMLHIFDSGVYRENTSNPSLPGSFDNGSGKELFAFVPRPLLPRLEDLYDAADPQPIYGVDGRTVAADVLIDALRDGGTEPDPCERRWRTVLVGGLREGSSITPASELPLTVAATSVGGYYALDITRPDAPIEQPNPADDFFFIPEIASTGVPSCFGDGEGAGLTAECGETPFGGILFEFNDMVDGVRLDEDDNGQVDLGLTWSTPNLGRIQVCTADCGAADFADRTIEDRYVAIFGGGLDPVSQGNRGNWLYIVDIETGQAIYKQRLRGSAPAEPAAVDTDLDGYLDHIYIGTLYGFLYRVDLAQGSGSTREVPELVNYTLSESQDLDGDTVPEVHTRVVERITDTDFAPRIFFSASANNATDTVTTVESSLATARPIYFRPSVIFVPELEQYAIAFGTGNREDLTLKDVPLARFFTVVDDKPWGALSDAGTYQALNKASLRTIDLSSAANADASSNFLTERPVGQRGWWMEFATDERLVTDPTTIVGVLIFSVFSPRTSILEPGVCEETGTSRLFAVVATNASGLLYTGVNGAPLGPTDPGTQSRFKTVSDLVTQPFAEQSQTKNAPGDLSELQPGEELLSVSASRAMEQIKLLLPPNCKFPPGYRIDLKTRDSKTGIEWIAPIPLCVMEKNFKDF